METSTNGSNGQAQAADLHLQEVIRSAERELHELLERRAELMKRIGTIKQTLAGLANIFGDGVLSDQLLSFLDRKSASRQPGFTRACRVVLMDAKKPLGARLVCQALQQKFPEVLERHKDPIASVTTVLNRLADYGEARCSLDAGRAPGLEVDCGTRGRRELARGRQRVFAAATSRKTVTGVTDCRGTGSPTRPHTSLGPASYSRPTPSASATRLM